MKINFDEQIRVKQLFTVIPTNFYSTLRGWPDINVCQEEVNSIKICITDNFTHEYYFKYED